MNGARCNERINAISLFSGGGQLDIGAKRALAAIGYDLRTVVYVEREAFAQEVLKARIVGTDPAAHFYS